MPDWLDIIIRAAMAFTLAGFAGFCVMALRGWWSDRPDIPQAEIDAEVRRIMVAHGTGEDAVAYAAGVVERSSGAKTSRQHRKLAKAERVLRVLKDRV